MERTAPWFVTSLVVALVAAVAAGETVRGGEWSVDDVVLEERASEWVLARDGTRAVWVRSEVVGEGKEEQRVSNLWLTRLREGESVPLTRGHDTVSAPAISPDGKRAAFLSTRGIPGAGEEVASPQVWIVPLDGGEAYPLTRFDRPVKGVAWIDTASLLVLAEESRSLWEREREEAGDDATLVHDAEHTPPVRLFRVSLEGGKVTRLTHNDSWIERVAVAPDGRRAVVVAQQSVSYEFDQRVPPTTELLDLADGTSVRLFEDGVLRPEAVSWAQDASGFYFVNEFSRHPRYRQATVRQLWFFDLARGSAEHVSEGWERGLGGAFAPTNLGVVALLADGVRYRAVRFERRRDGWRRVELAGRRTATIRDLVVSGDGGVVVFESSTATEPPQWYAARLAGNAIVEERVVTDLNRRYLGKPTGRAEVIRWRGARDEEVEGILYYPLAYEPGTRYPLVLDLHGGPAGTDADEWSQSWTSPIMLWRQRGAFVLQVNYHGSAGYGLDWVESIGGGKYYELEIPDIERGVDELIRRGLVDPQRLASSGWSNGGILTVELITRTQRYRAAAVGAADVEWISDWGNVAFGAAFDNYYLGGPPWEIPDVYVAKSPLFRLTAVTTPTIVTTGTADTNVPPGQSRSLFHALEQIGAAPVRLVLFPGEEHALKKIVHQRRKVEEDLAWFDRYLFGSPPPELEGVKAGSLLEGLLVRRGAARSGAAFGVLHGGVLVPETVALDGLEVGRFEVTRAQFAAFDASLVVAPGEENLPVGGVSFEQARAYAAWLAERTGRAFRLPTVEEATRLAAQAGGDGNTLNRWAGYPPNPDDTRRLHRALAPLPAGALLLPVGSLAPCAAGGAFDLDGNVAEWAVAPDGTGRAVGASADLPRDDRATATAAPAYTGLRVVVDRSPATPKPHQPSGGTEQDSAPPPPGG